MSDAIKRALAARVEELPWKHFVRISLLQPEGRIAEALGRIETFVDSLA